METMQKRLHIAEELLEKCAHAESNLETEK